MLDPLSTTPLPETTTQPALPVRKLLYPSPNSPDDYILEIDNSSLELFTICQRKSEYKLLHSREAVRNESALVFGQLFHKCEELRLRHGLTEEVLQKQRQLCVDFGLQHPCSPDDHRTSERMMDVLKKYNALYAEDTWPKSIVARQVGVEMLPMVEQSFKIELCTIPINDQLNYPYSSLVGGELNEHILATDKEMGWRHFFCRNLHILWTGRIDAIITQGNFTFVVDHKTTSSGGKEFEEAFRLASQTVGYTWAAQKILDRRVDGLIINEVLIRALGKTARATAPREEFNRLSYFYAQDRLDEWEESTKATVADFVSSLLRGYFPMSGPKSFKSPCVYCDYHDVCQVPRTGRASLLASPLFRDVTWNPVHE